MLQEKTGKFQDKTVIVTGSGAGIGRETALRFARQGAKVVVNSVSESAAAVRDEILAQGGRAWFFRADVSVAEQAKALVEFAAESCGGLDILVNNAGIVPGGSVEQIGEEEWDRAMAVNVKSVYLMSRYALPHLRKTKGNIVSTASVLAVKGAVNRAAYSATKAAMLGLSRSMAKEYVAEGIRVNCVSPGTVLTPSLEGRIAASPDPEKAREEFLTRQPMRRLLTPGEVADAILYLAGDSALSITGFNLVLDGGMTM